MNVSSIVNAGTRVLHRSVLVLQKNSPQILTAVGIAGTITSTVLSSKATLKLEPIIDDLNNKRELARSNKQDAALGAADLEGYTEKHYVGEVVRAYGGASLKLMKLYGPAFAVGGLSIVCLVGAQGIMQSRNAGLMAAYAAVDKSFAAYRKRVEEEIGPDAARDLQYDIVTERVENTKEGVVEEVLRVSDPTNISGYAKWFDEGNINFKSEPSYNLMFIKSQQQFANDRLRARGYLFLNEVYKSLGLPITPEGQVVGWVLDGTGDGYVDFGTFSSGAGKNPSQVVNGFEGAILLDFNVDGIVFQKVGKLGQRH